MKKLIILLAILSTGFISCKKDKASSPNEKENFTPENATVIAAGDLSFSSEKTNTGLAKIYRMQTGKYVLGLEKMNLNVGASLFILLSSTKTVSSSTAIKISSVISLYGDVFQELPSNIDFALYKYLIIQTEISEEIVATAELN